MSMNRPWRLDLDRVVERTVSRAGLLITAASAKFVLDADNDMFATLADMPPHSDPLALSYDGTHILVRSIEDNGRTIRLVSQTLSTGHCQSILAPADCFDHLAAFSHDAEHIATLSQDADAGHIDLVHIETGDRRRLWSCDGGATEHGTSIAWSPDGRLIAATYYDALTDELATVIIDASDGQIVANHEYRVVLGCPNGTWVDNNHLILIDDVSAEGTPPLYLVDAHSGNAQQLSRPQQWTHVPAVINGRVIARASDGNLYLTDLHGGTPQLVSVLPLDLGISSFDIAPHVALIGA